jgi:hypothetical protein
MTLQHHSCYALPQNQYFKNNLALCHVQQCKVVTATMMTTKAVSAGVFLQGGHKEVGKDDDDITSTAIPANDNGNANSSLQ